MAKKSKSSERYLVGYEIDEFDSFGSAKEYALEELEGDPKGSGYVIAKVIAVVTNCPTITEVK